MKLVPYIQSLLLFYEKKYQIWSPFLVFHNKIAAFGFGTTWNDSFHFDFLHQEVDYNLINGWHRVGATISIDEIGLNSWCRTLKGEFPRKWKMHFVFCEITVFIFNAWSGCLFPFHLWVASNYANVIYLENK